MAGYRKIKHIYDDNWEDRSQLRALSKSLWGFEDMDELFDAYEDVDEEEEEDDED